MGSLQSLRVWLRQMGRYWLPPVLWMAVMFGLSTDVFAAEHTGKVLRYVVSAVAPSVTYEQYTLLHHLMRKAAHLTEYALLACLLLRAFRADTAIAWRWRWAILSWLLTAGYACLDESHQALTQSRTSAASDSALDMCGGFIALTLLWLIRRKQDGLNHHGRVPKR
jgi:VanZ family protein